MMINYLYILVLGVNTIVCLPQSNQHEFSLNVTDKGTKDQRSLRDDKLKNKDENTAEFIDINGKVDKDVLNINEGMYTNQRLIPIYHGQAEHAVPRGWVPLHSRYVVPIVPNASAQIVTATYDSPFRKEVREPEVVAQSHIDEQINKNPTINPVESVYLVPPHNIAYTPGPDEAVIPIPYLGHIPVDPDVYNFQETGVLKKPLTYPSPFVQHRYFSMNGPQPYYYRHPVHPLPKYTPSINYGTILYQEPLPSTTAEKIMTGDLQDQGPEKTVKDNKVNNKHQIIVDNPNYTKLNADIPEYLTDFVRNFSDDSANIVNDRDNINQNSQQDNNFESSNFDTTVISGYVNPDAVYDFNNFDDGYPMHFVPNIHERHPQAIHSSYQNLEAKETPENTMKHPDNLGFIHNDDNVTHEPITYGQSHQHPYNTNENSKIDNSFDISNVRKVNESLSDKTDITYNNIRINHAFVDTQNIDNWSKNETIIERKDEKQEFDHADNPDQSDNLVMLVDSVRKESTESKNTVFNDKIEAKDMDTGTHIIFTANIENISEFPLGTDREEKDQESLDITNKTKHDENSGETPSTETNTKILDVDNRTTGTDIYKEDVKIETTTHIHNQDIYTPQIEAPLDDSDKLILNKGNRSTVDIENTNIKITTDENPFIDKNEMNSNPTNETSTLIKEEFNTTNNVQPTDSREKIYDNGGRESAEDSVEDTTSRDDTKCNVEMNNYKTQNKPASPDKLKYENYSENYYKEEEKANTENNEEYNIEFESTLSETTSDRQESDEKYVKLSPNKLKNFGNPKVKRIDTESFINQNTNKNPVGLGNDSNSENISKVTDDKYLEEVITVSDKNTDPERDTFPPSDSDRDNDDDQNDSADDFGEISSALQTSTEESIKSKLGFTTTCIRHPVDISMSDSKNAAEPIGLEFYRKIFEEYYKKHNAIPLTVIQKNIRSFVYKNGTIVNVITEAVWDVDNDEKPVEISTRKTIQQRKKKTSKRN